jgi:transcriptional regulator with XRE-family HTH domain
MNRPLNVVGRQVRKLRTQKGWTQEVLAQKLQLQAWDISRTSLAKLESQLRRVPDCELLFLASVLGVAIGDLFPANLNLKRIGPELRR